MVATNRLFQDFVSGTTSVALTDVETTLSGVFLTGLPVVADPDFIAVTLDPEAVDGAPEIVWVTTHTVSETTGTISRGREGTTARAHNSGIKAVAALTADAIEAVDSAASAAESSVDALESALGFVTSSYFPDLYGSTGNPSFDALDRSAGYIDIGGRTIGWATFHFDSLEGGSGEIRVEMPPITPSGESYSLGANSSTPVGFGRVNSKQVAVEWASTSPPAARMIEMATGTVCNYVNTPLGSNSTIKIQWVF